MISFLNDIFVILGGVYLINRLLYRFYFPKKPKFLPLQQLIMDDSASSSWLPFRKSQSAALFKISVNLDDHNRLINPLLTQVRNRSLSGDRIFKACLNVMLPRYEKSIYIYNSQEFLNFCERKAHLHSLGKNIAFSETLELIPELIKRFHRRGPLFFQIDYSLQSVSKRKILTIIPTAFTGELKPRFSRAKIQLLHEDEGRQSSPYSEPEKDQTLKIFIDKNDVLIGRPNTSFLIFHLNEKNQLVLAFLASNRPFFTSCYHHSCARMLEVMLGSKIPLERTRFIDEPALVDLIRRGKVIELLALMEDGLINAVTELSSYGKTYFLNISKEPDSLFMKISTLQRDLMVKKVHARLFNQEVKRLWL